MKAKTRVEHKAAVPDELREPPPGFGLNDPFAPRKLEAPVRVLPEFGLPDSRSVETTEDGLLVAVLMALKSSPIGRVTIEIQEEAPDAR